MPRSFSVNDQHDFTSGEIDPAAKRTNDDPVVRASVRQALNSRILNTKSAANRQGRNALQVLTTSGRVEDVLIAPGVRYRLAFTNNTLTIYDATGAQVFTEGGRAWTSATIGLIRWAVLQNSIYITYNGVVPEVLTWDGGTVWSSAPFAEQVSPGGQKRTPFYRIAPKGNFMNVSAVTGAVTVTVQAPYFTPAMVGTRVRYINRQILLTGFTNSTNMTGTVIEPLPGSQFIGFTINPNTIFNLGDLVEGTVSGAQGYVVTLTAGAIGVQLMSAAVTGVQSPASTASAGGDIARDSITQIAAYGFVVTDTIVGAGGALPANGLSSIGNPNFVPFWDEEVMNSFRGWPKSVSADQGRLIFCDFPSVPNAPAWSAIGNPTDLYPDAFPSSAMFEPANVKMRIQDVVPGPEGSEFVMADVGIFYIPISPSNPLKPSSVQYQKISSDGAGTMQPRSVGEAIVYANQGLTQLFSIIAIGQTNRPYVTAPLTDIHSHLFNNIQAIALPTSVTQYPERYAYVLNGDGTMAVGRYALDEAGRFVGKIGWVPWNGSWTAKWISALQDVVLMVDSYTSGGNTAFMVEQVDATQYLDASIPINAIPSTLTPPGGKGVLWWLPGATVDLMDGTFPLGPHATDANGFIVPNQPGEDLTSATLRAGFTWTMILEPYLLPAPGGQDSGQRVRKRRCSRFEAYMANSTGFSVHQIYTGQQGPNLPPLGTYIGGHRIPAYNQDDDATKAPPLREQAYTFRPRGRAYDPRIAIVKDTPGPLTVVETSSRVSV